jgi:hypothetical protein
MEGKIFSIKIKNCLELKTFEHRPVLLSRRTAKHPQYNASLFIHMLHLIMCKCCFFTPATLAMRERLMLTTLHISVFSYYGVSMARFLIGASLLYLLNKIYNFCLFLQSLHYYNYTLIHSQKQNGRRC